MGEPVSANVGGGGRIYQDSRLQDQVRAARAAAALDQAPWADRPEPDDTREAPPVETPKPAPPPEPAPPPASAAATDPAEPEPGWDGQEVASTALELLGMVCLTAAGFVITLWLGLVIAGICLLVTGVLTSRRFDT